MRIKNDFLRNYLFWILQGVALLTIIICWFVGTMGIDKKTSSEASKIKANFSKLKTIQETDQHPNEKTIAQTIDDTKKQKKTVNASWKVIYENQKKVLEWPIDLQADFITKVKELGQPESIKGALDGEYTERYRNYIAKEVVKLPWLIGDNWRVPTKQVLNKKLNVREKLYCVWSTDSQKKASERLRYSDTTNSIKLLYRQEDLWVYQALLTIIDKTNGGKNYSSKKNANQAVKKPDADKAPEDIKQEVAEHSPSNVGVFNSGHYNAIIKKIIALDIATDVKPPLKSKGFVGMKIVKNENEENFDDSGDSGSNDELGGDDSPGDEDAATRKWMKIAKDRYVDAKGKKLKGSALAKIPNQEFKRMPIYMKVIVDQRRITDLLVECANSPLTVEVTQLSFTKMPDGDNVKAPSDKDTVDNALTTDWDREVEIYGVINIFNPAPEKEENTEE